MKNYSVRWYSEGTNPKNPSQIDGRQYNAFSVKRGSEANKVKANFRRIDIDDNIESFQIGVVPLKVYHTAEDVTIVFYHDQNDISVQLAGRNLVSILTTAQKMELPTADLQKIVEKKI